MKNGEAENASTSGFGSFKARSETRLALIARDNPSRLKLFQNVYAGTATRNQCIRAFCCDCMGFDSAGIKNCGDRCCPIWRFRPYQPTKKKGIK